MKLPLSATLAVFALPFGAFAGTPSLDGSIIETDLHKSDRWADGDYAFGTWDGLRTRLALSLIHI